MAPRHPIVISSPLGQRGRVRLVMKSLYSIGAEIRRAAVIATVLALGTLASCSKHNPAPPMVDGGPPHDGPTDGKPKVDMGGDTSVDACAANGTPQVLGGSCGCNAQCASGFCVEGVCCATACTGGCNTCSAAGSVRTESVRM